MKTAAIIRYVVLSCIFLFIRNASAQQIEPTWESMAANYQVPDWFVDGKLGVWFHWGIPSSIDDGRPHDGSHYGAWMYGTEGQLSAATRHPAAVERLTEWHNKHYGHYSEFGYEDLIPQFKAENWDPDALVKLVKDVGAHFIMPVACHHDNFDMYDSSHPWNSVDMGPKRDTLMEWKAAAQKHGLKFGVSTHLYWSPRFFSSARKVQTPGTLASKLFNMDYDPKDYSNQDSWNEHWYARCWEIIEKYEPDMFNNDSPYPNLKTGNGLGLKLFSNYVKKDREKNNGKQSVVLSFKDLKKSRKAFTYNMERGSAAKIEPEPWMWATDLSGIWFYRDGVKNRMSIPVMVSNAIDSISKNGVVMLNIALKGDGTIPDNQMEYLDAFRQLFQTNGEALYESRPWKIFGEGPLVIKDGRGNENKKAWSQKDIRFTQKGDDLYAFVMAPPTEDISIKTLAKGGLLETEIKSITLLGSDEDIDWDRSDAALTIKLPKQLPKHSVIAFKVTSQVNANGADASAPVSSDESSSAGKAIAPILTPSASGQPSVSGSSERPNIVVFVADDMGWGDSGTYGHPLIKTPNLDKLASRGVKLTQCYSACGVCSPSRSAILTGRHPYRNGVWRHLSGKHPAHLRASEITYPNLLKSIGYETCHVGKWHLNSLAQFNTPEFPQPGDHGYGYWMTTHNNAHPSHKNPDNFVRNGKPIGKQQGYSAQIVGKETASWLREKRDKTKPFALSVWVHEPHSPIATDPKFADLYGDHDNRTYMGNISQLDAAVGQVMQTLDQEGVTDNTLFIFTSDNGPVPKFGGTAGGLRGVKRSDHEGGIRVPGIVSWPGHIAPGTTSSIPVVGTDIFTTVLAITGAPVPDDRTIDGVNMLPALAGKPVERPIPLFWRTHVSKPDNRVAMRIGDWKIVGDDTLTTFQLYEIEKDWQENNDLASSMPDKTESMKLQLLQVWDQIKSEGPNEWWESEKNKPVRGGTLNY